MAGTLFVVATPIGNLEDITLRALRVLREVALVAAEDTRRTGNLLRHYQITTPLISVRAHNERQRSQAVLERLQRGESVALVSDAGTPGISDPGALVVRTVRDAGLRVEPVPGPSAVTAALSASGWSLEKFAFAGFPPIRSKDRKRWLEWIRELDDTPVVCFEAPHRITRTLAEIRSVMVERPIIVVRELTKKHEEWLQTADAPPERGEFTILIGRTPEIVRTEITAGSLSEAAVNEIAVAFGEITKTEGGTRRAAIRSVATRLHLPVRVVYDALERSKT
jgi:16S rRNA (cytidine1402-2'-O)-methyltransferase